MTNAEKTEEILKNKGYHISFAESCTGGMAASSLVDVAGSSAVLDVSFVTYANEAKISYLGVDPETINSFGVVSEQVTAQMCEGVALRAGAQVGVGISGIAGPGGGTEKKPVGTVCFGFYVDGVIETFTEHFGDIGRSNVRKKATDFVFAKLVEKLSVCD